MYRLTGVEDGQTVRMSVGKREIFITFRVSFVFEAFNKLLKSNNALEFFVF